VIYSATFEDFGTGTSDNTYVTACNIIVPDTTDGHRIRLRKIWLGPASNSPADLNIGVRVMRVADISAGAAGTAGATVAAADMGKADPGAIDPFFTAGIEYSAEPSTYETEALFQDGLNAHATLTEYWGPDEAPIATRDMSLALLICPRGTTDTNWSGGMEVEWY